MAALGDFDVLFFGCGPREAGHYWWPSWPRAERRAALPAWLLEENVDCGLLPDGAQVEGVVRVHRREGWSAFAWWDRSGDKRGNSNSVLAVKDEAITFEEALRLGRERFPWAFERIVFELREG